MGMEKTIKINGGTITFTPDEVVELSIDKKINKLRYDILNLETQLYKMLHPKDSKEQDFLPPGNEIPFDFGKTKYDDMISNLNYSIKDLNNIKKLAEQINKIKK
jgi:hypothetical protein